LVFLLKWYKSVYPKVPNFTNTGFKQPVTCQQLFVKGQSSHKSSSFPNNSEKLCSHAVVELSDKNTLPTLYLMFI